MDQPRRFDYRTEATLLANYITESMRSDEIHANECPQIGEWEVVAVPPSVMLLGVKAFRSCVAWNSDRN